MTTISTHAASLASIRANRDAGRGWRRGAEALARALQHDGATVLARQLREAAELGGRPSTMAQVSSLLAQVAGTLAELDGAPATAVRVIATLDTSEPATFDSTPAPADEAELPGPVDLRRWSHDSVQLWPGAPGGTWTMYLQRDGRDEVHLTLTPEVVDSMLATLMASAQRPRIV